MQSTQRAAVCASKREISFSVCRHVVGERIYRENWSSQQSSLSGAFFLSTHRRHDDDDDDDGWTGRQDTPMKMRDSCQFWCPLLEWRTNDDSSARLSDGRWLWSCEEKWRERREGWGPFGNEMRSRHEETRKRKRHSHHTHEQWLEWVNFYTQFSNEKWAKRDEMMGGGNEKKRWNFVEQIRVLSARMKLTVSRMRFFASLHIFNFCSLWGEFHLGGWECVLFFSVFSSSVLCDESAESTRPFRRDRS